MRWAGAIKRLTPANRCLPSCPCFSPTSPPESYWYCCFFFGLGRYILYYILLEGIQLHLFLFYCLYIFAWLVRLSSFSVTAFWQKIWDKNDITPGFSAFLCLSLGYKSRTIQWKIIPRAHFEKKSKIYNFKLHFAQRIFQFGLTLFLTAYCWSWWNSL